MKTRSFTGAVCLLSGLLLASAGNANRLNAAPAGRGQETAGASIRLGRQTYTEAELATYVRLAYGKLSGYLQADGATAEFQVSGFRTVLASDFKRVPYSEVVSPPGAAKLDVTRIEMTDRGSQKTSVAYRPRLRQPDPLATETWGNVVRGESFGDVMKLATDEPQLADARALTTFLVRRTIGVNTDTYRAAFLWLVDAEGSQLRIYVADPFTKGVDLALGEPYLPGRGELVPRPQTKTCVTDLDCPDDGGDGSAAQCKTTSSQFTPNEYVQTGSENHNSGGHSMNFRTTFTCQCQSNCTSSCQPSPSITCSDSQDISGLNSYHNAVGNMAVEVGSTSDGRNVSTQCMTGGGCAVRECLTATFCSLTVNVSITHSGVTAGVSLTTSEGVVWSRTAQFNHSCAKCERFTPPPPPPPSGGGDTVNPVPWGGPSLWSVDCGTNGSVDYYVTAYSRSEAQMVADMICP
jgi:hypothetical protein